MNPLRHSNQSPAYSITWLPNKILVAIQYEALRHNDAQPIVPADRLRRPLNYNVRPHTTNMIAKTAEEKILAHALYKIRVLLSPYLGSEAEGQIEVRIAAHLAYALHNEALAVIEGRHFDVEEAITKVKAVDDILNAQDGSRLSKLITSEKP